MINLCTGKIIKQFIPKKTIKKCIMCLPKASDKWKNDNEYCKLMSTFLNSFLISDLLKLIDSPTYEQFLNLLETNLLYAPSRGGMIFLQMSPVYSFFIWLSDNLYEQNNIGVLQVGLRYEKIMNDQYKILNEFVNNQTLENYMYIIKNIFCYYDE